MFNPICTSLRAVQQGSELKKVQRKLGCPRSSFSSLSEVATVFDSALTQEIVTDLAGQLKPISSHAKLDEIAAIVTAVDGILINALPKMTWALWKKDQMAIKAHVQLLQVRYVFLDVLCLQFFLCHDRPLREQFFDIVQKVAGGYKLWMAEKNSSGPHRSKFPPACPDFDLCPNDFSLDQFYGSIVIHNLWVRIYRRVRKKGVPPRQRASPTAHIY